MTSSHYFYNLHLLETYWKFPTIDIEHTLLIVLYRVCIFNCARFALSNVLFEENCYTFIHIGEQTSVFESSALKFNSSPRKADVILNGALKLFSLYHCTWTLDCRGIIATDRSTITHEFLLIFQKKKIASDKYSSFKCFRTLGKKIDSLKKLYILTFSISRIVNLKLVFVLFFDFGHVF